jgi:hypothetical protein
MSTIAGLAPVMCRMLFWGGINYGHVERNTPGANNKGGLPISTENASIFHLWNSRVARGACICIQSRSCIALKQLTSPRLFRFARMFLIVIVSGRGGNRGE